MTFFAGHTGTIRLRRNTPASSFASRIYSDDINATLNRVGFDGSIENILTGDRLVIETEDPRGLDFLPASAWDVGEKQSTASLYVNANLAGGLRFFRNFNSALNNDRAQEISLNSFTGGPLPITVSIEEIDYNTLGGVTGFTLQTERDSIETTVLSDKFKQQYSAGLISGSGSIDCFFQAEASGLNRQELPLLMLQIIQRVEIGSSFEAELFLTDDDVYGSNLDVYYKFSAVITRAGVEVRSDSLISCSIDFLSTGEIQLLVGTAPGRVLKEDLGYILTKELSVDSLLKEIDD